ncbi:MAG: hypothetical protein QME64_05540 [bacterium]|nr:hypothetical protein [bacterium]
MRKKYIISIIALVSMLLGSLVFAQPPYYVVGDAPGLPWWGTWDATSILYDDGTNGDTIAGDRVYTRDISIVTPGDYQYKISRAGWATTYPAENGYFSPTVANETVKFWLDTNAYPGGWSPASHIPNHSADPLLVGAHTFNAVGTWQDEAGNLFDWDPTALIHQMRDDGLGGDTLANDSIYTLVVTINTTGMFEYKGTSDGGWNRQITATGKTWNLGAGVNFTVLVANDTVKFECDIIKGRIKATPQTGVLPGYYALGDVQGSTPDASTRMYDDGTNGDQTASDRIYTRAFEVASPGDHYFKVLHAQAGGGQAYYPPTGDGCYYVTSLSNETVRLLFDTNTTYDDWYPMTNFAFEESTTTVYDSLPYVAIGDFQWGAGAPGNWSPNDTTATNLIYSGSGNRWMRTCTFIRGSYPSGFSYKVAAKGGWEGPGNNRQIGTGGRTQGSGDPDKLAFTIANLGDRARFDAEVVKGRIKVTLVPTIVSGPSALRPSQQAVYRASGGFTPYSAWTSSNPSVALVVTYADDTAVVEGVSLGTATIVVGDSMWETDSIVVTVTPTAAPIAVDPKETVIYRSTPLWMLVE